MIHFMSSPANCHMCNNSHRHQKKLGLTMFIKVVTICRCGKQKFYSWINCTFSFPPVTSPKCFSVKEALLSVCEKVDLLQNYVKCLTFILISILSNTYQKKNMGNVDWPILIKTRE